MGELTVIRKLLGNAHRPALDDMSPSQIRVVCEHLLYTMDGEQRRSLMAAFPGLYAMVFPDREPVDSSRNRE
jgi:hypothetical protein